MRGRGCAWQGTEGACVAGGMHGRGSGTCVAGGMAIAAGGTHPTGMHSCFLNLVSHTKLLKIVSQNFMRTGGFILTLVICFVFLNACNCTYKAGLGDWANFYFWVNFSKNLAHIFLGNIIFFLGKKQKIDYFWAHFYHRPALVF